MKFLRFCLVISLVLVPVLASAQEESTGTVKCGLTATVQDSELGIMVPFYLTEKFILAPGIQFAYFSEAGTDIVLGLSSRSFFNSDKKVRPYWGLKAAVGYYNPKSSDSQTDFIFGAALGVEYFFSPNFSVGIEPQLNMTLSDDESDRFGNPGKVGINTATVLTANIYF